MADSLQVQCDCSTQHMWLHLTCKVLTKCTHLGLMTADRMVMLFLNNTMGCCTPMMAGKSTSKTAAQVVSKIQFDLCWYHKLLSSMLNHDRRVS